MTTGQRYTVEHETRYIYTAPVSQSWQLARANTRIGQGTLHSSLISPHVHSLAVSKDGNRDSPRVYRAFMGGCINAKRETTNDRIRVDSKRS